MPNPKGNPKNIQKSTTDREEPLTEKMNIRMSEHAAITILDKMPHILPMLLI